MFYRPVPKKTKYLLSLIIPFHIQYYVIKYLIKVLLILYMCFIYFCVFHSLYKPTHVFILCFIFSIEVAAI